MATVRKATKDDLETIRGYNIAMAKESEDLVLPADVARAGVVAVLNGEAAAAFYVAEVDGAVIGQLMITYEWSDWRAKNIWWIQSVYVHPDHRKCGHFRLLYNYVKEEAQTAGACGVRLYADVHNVRAQATYEKLGMTSHYKVYEDMFTSY